MVFAGIQEFISFFTIHLVMLVSLATCALVHCQHVGVVQLFSHSLDFLTAPAGSCVCDIQLVVKPCTPCTFSHLLEW